jgi:hypothetical protein
MKKKPENKGKMSLNIFKKVTSLLITFFALTYSKLKIFKIFKTDDALNYLAKSVEQFFQNHIPSASHPHQKKS